MKYAMVLFLAIVIHGFSYAEGLYGTKSIPGDYNSLSEAIVDLNTQGVGSGGVVIRLLAGNPETAPAGGYAITTLSGTSSNPIVIQGNGNIITASPALNVGNLNDAIFKVIGGDYITIQGFIMQENSANTVTAAATNNMTEFGVALFYATVTDGAKNITIQNNTISLSRLYQNSFGIYSNVRHSPTAISTAADITNVSGANDNTHIYNNEISNVNQGIVIIGSITGAYMNTGIDIGGNSVGTGNTISNYGSTGTFSGYVSVSGSVMGINTNNCLNTNVQYNSIACPGLNTAGTVYGYYNQASGTIPTTGGPFTTIISHNTFAIKSGFASGIIYGLNHSFGNSVFNFDISYNDFNNFGHTGLGTGAINICYISGVGNVATINHNTFTSISVNTTASVYLLYYNFSMPLATSTQQVSNNSVISAFSKTGAGGAVYCMYSDATSVAGSTKTVTNNNFSNITVTGATALYVIYENDGGTPTKYIHDNIASSLTGGTATVTGMLFGYGNGNYYNNSINLITSAYTVTGISLGSGSNSLYSNTIYGLTTTGTVTATGIAINASTNSRVYKNSISNIQINNASGKVMGITVSAGTAVYVYNNFVSGLKAPVTSLADAIRGINITSTTTNSTIGLYYNSIYLDGTSSGTNFGTTGIYHTYSSVATTAALDMRNNIVVNNSTPAGSGLTVAFRRSAATNLNNYGTLSNNNCFYAGVPDASHLLMYDGTNSCQNIPVLQAAVSPRETFSFCELPPFVNVATTPYDLHISSNTATLCESGGNAIMTPISITDDFDGDARGVIPDVGADEFEWFIEHLPPSSFTVTARNSHINNISFTPNMLGDNVVIIWNTTGMFTVPVGPPPTPGGSIAGGTVLYQGTNSPQLHTGLTNGTTYYYKAYSFYGTTYSYGVTAWATPSVNPPTGFTAIPVSDTQINLGWTLNTYGDNVIIATNSTGTFGTPVNGTNYNIDDPITGGGTVIYKGPLSAFSHTGLNASTAYYYKVWSEDEFSYYSAAGATTNATTACAYFYLPIYESFESTTFAPECWINSAVSGSAVWSRSNSASGNGSGVASAFANFFNQSQNQVYDLITPSFTIDACDNNTYVRFNYAYATYSGEVDEMDIYYSTDSGLTWTILLAMPGGTAGILNTGGTVTSSFVPTSSQWGYRMIFLPSGTNRLKFRAISAYGNNLYLDNIQIQSAETARDVEAVSVDLGQVVPLGTITPKATVKNNGFVPETFDVTMTIGSYFSTETVVALSPGATQQVSFAPWTNSEGSFTAVVNAYSSCGDINFANNTVSKEIKVMALNKTVYAWTTFSTSNDGPVSFNLNNPGTLNGIVNEYPITSYPTSGTWANDKWYAAIYNTAPPYSLVTFNPTTGLRTSIGDIGVNINALSYNSVDSSMYGIGYDGTNSLLYSINTTSATSTYIGTITSRLIISLAINDAGVAYAVDRGDDVLGTINLTTAEFTSIGSIGFDANEPQNMEFDRETGELFMASYNTFGELRWVDKTTGNTLVIGQFQDGHKLTGFGIPYTSSKTLSLTCLLQGIYNGGGTMRKAQNETGDQFPGDTVDLITIELHNSVNYSTIDYSLNNISLSTNGICSHKVPGILNGPYYITVKHRNSIETTTPFPVSFGGGTINYNFTTDASKAFGGNLNHTPDGYWIIFSGDVNQDGTVDESDIINLNNQSSTFATGYIPDDVNGDGLIDAADMIIIDNNSSNLIFSMHPGN